MIYVVEVLILRFLLPVINIYIMVQVLNYLAGEEYLSQFAELLSKMVTWILKTLVTCVIGINVIQGMLAPAIDALKRSALTKTAEAIPGIGNAIGGVTDVVLGTAVLIKNGIGMAGAAVMIAICAIPIVQMALMTLCLLYTSKASENAVLTCRVIDRPMRPLFPKDYRNDVTLENLVMSVDQDCSPELTAMLGSAIATSISDIPFDGPISTTQVGLVNGEFVFNPTAEQKDISDLTLTVASTKEKVIMIEAGANEVPERCV